MHAQFQPSLPFHQVGDTNINKSVHPRIEEEHFTSPYDFLRRTYWPFCPHKLLHLPGKPNQQHWRHTNHVHSRFQPQYHGYIRCASTPDKKWKGEDHTSRTLLKLWQVGPWTLYNLTKSSTLLVWRKKWNKAFLSHWSWPSCQCHSWILRIRINPLFSTFNARTLTWGMYCPNAVRRTENCTLLRTCTKHWFWQSGTTTCWTRSYSQSLPPSRYGGAFQPSGVNFRLKTSQTMIYLIEVCNNTWDMW